MMKCSRAQQLVLLQQTGEISARKSARLRKHFQECKECRQFQSDMVLLTSAAQEANRGIKTPQTSMDAILDQARGHREAHDRERSNAEKIIHFPLPRPVMALAAVALVAVAITIFMLGRVSPKKDMDLAGLQNRASAETANFDSSWNDELDDEIEQLSLALRDVEESLSNGTIYYDGISGDPDELASQLLSLEESS